MTTATVPHYLPADEYNAALESLKAEGVDPGRQEVETVFCFDRCLEKLSQIKPEVELKHRILQATDFVNNIILTKDGSLQEMELFIETEIFGYFDIPSGKNHQINQIAGGHPNLKDGVCKGRPPLSWNCLVFYDKTSLT
jgi:hypothetical protein